MFKRRKLSPGQQGVVLDVESHTRVRVKWSPSGECVTCSLEELAPVPAEAVYSMLSNQPPVKVDEKSTNVPGVLTASGKIQASKAEASMQVPAEHLPSPPTSVTDSGVQAG